MVESFRTSEDFCNYWAGRISDPVWIRRMAMERFDTVPSLASVKAMIFDAARSSEVLAARVARTEPLEAQDWRGPATDSLDGDPLLRALWREHSGILEHLASKGLQVVRP